MGLADVLAVTATRLWGVFAVACGAMVAWELTGTVGRYPGPAEGALLAVSGVALALTGSRPAAGLVAASAVLAWSGPHPATMLVFLFWGSLALALFNGVELAAALRWQAGLCYLFAGANKLFDPFLSGRVLYDIAPWIPEVRTVAAVSVVAELLLGVLVLLRWRWTPAAVVLFHAPLVWISARDWWHGATLVAYAGMILWAVVVGLGARRPTPALATT